MYIVHIILRKLYIIAIYGCNCTSMCLNGERFICQLDLFCIKGCVATLEAKIQVLQLPLLGVPE